MDKPQERATPLDYIKNMLYGGSQAVATSALEQVTGGPLNNMKNWAQSGSMPKLSRAALYKGCTAGLAGIVPISASQMLLYELFAKIRVDHAYEGNQAALPLTDRGICAVVAGGSTALSFGAALEALLIKTSVAVSKAQLQKKSLPSPWQLLRESRMRSLYRAAHLCAVRDGLFTLGYKTGSELLDPSEEDRPFWIQVSIAMVAGGGAGLVTHPLDTLRTRVLTTPSQSVPGTLGGIIKKEGFRGLWKGAVWRVPRAAIFTALYGTVCYYTDPV